MQTSQHANTQSTSISSPTHSQGSGQGAHEVGFAKRPQRSNNARIGRPVQLISNNYKLVINTSQDKCPNKYYINFDPEIPDTSKLNRKLTALASETLKKKFDKYILWGNNLYSMMRITDEVVVPVVYDGQDYKVTVGWAKAITENDRKEFFAYVSIVFKRIMRSLSFERDGRAMYNPKKLKNIQNLDIWPGFFSSIQKLENGPLIQIDLANKVVRQDLLISIIQDLLQKGKSKEQINDELKFKSVVTNYGRIKHNYQIERIDFDQSPMSTFKKGRGEEEKEITYAEYYLDQYQKKIRDTNQPLAIAKNQRTGQEIALIPELCQMTGLTDGQRANFNLMKDLSSVLHKSGQERIEEVKALMDEINQMPKAKEFMDSFNVQFNKQPLEVNGMRLPAGNVKMGNSFEFDAHCNGNDFDRNTQKPMLKQIKLQKWAIFFGRNSAKEANMLKSTFQQVMQGFKFGGEEPRLVQVQGDDRRFQTWKNQFEQILDPSVTCVVVLLQGNKNGAPLYDDVKKLLISTMPVPSQVVLHNTIARGKNLRSIVTKILIQINSKIGGEPWAISDMPFTKKPTMVVGYDVFHKPGTKSYLAFCATTNLNFNKYWVSYKRQGQYQEISDSLQSVVEESIEAFKNVNGIYPQQMIFYRDGVGEGQKNAVMKTELVQIREAIKKKEETKDIKILFLMVNKKIKTKLVTNTQGRIMNPQPGTCLDNAITQEGAYDFFLVSQSTRQGVPTPTHYTVLVDDIKENADNVMLLTYKLCYTYFNYSGSVKIPSPVKYADKLAFMMGDRQIDEPHKFWKQPGKGLYFI